MQCFLTFCGKKKPQTSDVFPSHYMQDGNKHDGESENLLLKQRKDQLSKTPQGLALYVKGKEVCK